MAARTSARFSGVALRPRMAPAGSPDKSSVAAKTRIETASSVSRPASRRLTTYQASGWRRVCVRQAAGAGAGAVASVTQARKRRGRTAARPQSVRVPCGSHVEPDVAVVPAAEVEPGARHDPLHVVCVRIEDLDVRPEDVAALVVLDLLYLLPEVDRLLLRRSPLRGADELVVRRVAPVRLVPDRFREQRLLVPDAEGRVRPE